MIVKESDIRAKIRRLLTEGSLTFYSPLGREEDFNIITPEVNGINLDLSKDSSFDVIRLSKIVDAMTSADSQNIIAWQTVAEGFLQNFGFSAPLGKNSDFYDVTKDDVGYNVKSSFAKEDRDVFSNAHLNFGTLFDKKHNQAFVKPEISKFKRISIIICFRKNNIFDKTFKIVWQKTPDMDFEEFIKKLREQYPKNAPKKLDSFEDQPAQQLDLFKNYSEKTNEAYDRATKSEVDSIFGGFSPLLTITFKDYSRESTESYRQKLEIMNVLRRASDEQLSSIFNYFQSNGFFESNQSQ